LQANAYGEAAAAIATGCVTMTDLAGNLTYNATVVLSAIAQGRRYGLEVIDLTGLSSGTIYPALRRLEAAGLVEGEWEDELRAQEEGRPARRNYRVTRAGKSALSASLERIRAQQVALGWLPRDA
jgi:DNA-binding PadR family transcriptional regulator